MYQSKLYPLICFIAMLPLFDSCSKGSDFPGSGSIGDTSHSSQNPSSSGTIADGTIYVTSEYGGPPTTAFHAKLFALDASTGTLKWKYEWVSNLACGTDFSNGLVYAGLGGDIVCIDGSTKDVKWQYKIADHLEVRPFVKNNVVYAAGTDSCFYAFDALTGHLKWKTFDSTGGRYWSYPAMDDNVLYSSTTSGSLYALDALTGKPKWVKGPPYYDGSYIDPVVVNGTIYVTLFPTGDVVAMNSADGKLKWQYSAINGYATSAIVAGKTIYAGAFNQVYAIDTSTGSKKWGYSSSLYIRNRPAVSNGVVYASFSGANTAIIYALDASTGGVKWTYGYDYPTSSTALIFSNTVYIGGSGSLLALDALTGKLKWCFTGDGDEEIGRDFCIVDDSGNVFNSSRTQK